MFKGGDRVLTLLALSMAVSCAAPGADAPAARLELGSPFSDRMVLQRDRPVRVWGWADAGAEVAVAFAGQTKKSVAAPDGTWRVQLDPLPASKESRDLTVIANPESGHPENSSRTILRDILVGEVWIACGQSNMEFPVCGGCPRFRDRQGALTVQSCYRPNVRFANIRSGASREPRARLNKKIEWRDFRPENLRSKELHGALSAVAFYFALDLNVILDIPVGIVAADAGWTPINTWTPREGTLSVPSLKEVADWKFVEFPSWSKTNVFKSVEAWQHQPALMWNANLAPIAPMSVRGVLWYQGCNDAKWADTYCDKLHAFYNGWSAKFENPDLRLYLVQLAPWGAGSKFARLQIAQDRFAREERNAGIAHINDLGMRSEIHPEHKSVVARRLATLALKRDYGFTDIVADPPMLEQAWCEGDAVRLTFSSVREFYVSNPDRSSRADFEIAGADGVYHPAEIVNLTKISEKAKHDFWGEVEPGNALVVRAAAVKDPRKVRYLMRDAWIGSIYNEADLPLGPFEVALPTRCRLRTPPMGWTSWNAYEVRVSQELVAATARAMVEKGLAAHGYRYVNIDSCWQGDRKSPAGALQADPRVFPDMAGLVRTIHSLGLKAGIYSTPMVWAWGGDNGRLLRGGTGYPLDPKYYHHHWGGCGQTGYETVDARQFAEWGFDWLKYDWPKTDVEHARRMREALDATGRDFVLQVCTSVRPEDADEMAKYADLARGSTDTKDDWKWMTERDIFRKPDRWLGKIRPGFWYDMDMLAVGPLQLERRSGPVPPDRPLDDEHRNRLTHDEAETHFAYWAILPAPLVLSCDILHIDDWTLRLVTNDDLIAINQDFPATAARPKDFGDGRRLLTRTLSDGRTVLGFFNLGETAWSVDHALGRSAPVRDVLRREDLGAPGRLTFGLAPHACRVFVQ